MAFTQKLPEWNAPGVEPSATQKQTGFQPGMKPPAQWFNWHLNWSYLALKELQEKAAEKTYVDSIAEELREEFSGISVPDASLTEKGIVQLSNSITSQSQILAATSKAVDDARASAISASLPRTGGALTGPLRVSSWGEVSASSGGYVLYGHNCYLDASGVTYRYRNTHANMGARGIVFRLGAGLQGAWMFDMGAIATTAGASFTPTLKRLLNTDDYDEIQGLSNNRSGYGTTSNSGNNYAVTLVPAPTSYVDGLRITIKINATNTGAVTINVNGLGAKSVLKSNGSAMAANGLRANSVYSLVYNGTDFILQGEGGEYGTAVAGDVRSTKTIGTDAGLVTGTLVTRNTTSINPGLSAQNFPGGIYPDFVVQASPFKSYSGNYSVPAGSYVNVPIGFSARMAACSRQTDVSGVAMSVAPSSAGGLKGGANMQGSGYLIYVDGNGDVFIRNDSGSTTTFEVLANR